MSGGRDPENPENLRPLTSPQSAMIQLAPAPRIPSGVGRDLACETTTVTRTFRRAGGEVLRGRSGLRVSGLLGSQSPGHPAAEPNPYPLRRSGFRGFRAILLHVPLPHTPRSVRQNAQAAPRLRGADDELHPVLHLRKVRAKPGLPHPEG